MFENLNNRTEQQATDASTTDTTADYQGHGTAKIDLTDPGNDLGDAGDGPPYRIHGYAIGAGDKIDGEHGRLRWPAETLDSLAETLEGRPLTDKHSSDARATVGEITAAAYDGTGVAYEAELDDSGLAKRIANGRLEVSPRIAHAETAGMATGADGVMTVRSSDAGEFRHLAIVQRGAAPSNSVASGASPSPALADASASTVRQSLADCGAVDLADSPRETNIPTPDDSEEWDRVCRALYDAGIRAEDFVTPSVDDETNSAETDSEPAAAATTSMSNYTNETEDLAESVLAGEDVKEKNGKNLTAAAYLEGKFRVDASEYNSRRRLHDAVMDAKHDIPADRQYVDAAPETDGHLADFAEQQRTGSATGRATAADRLARDHMAVDELRGAVRAERSPTEHLNAEYGIDAAEYLDASWDGDDDEGLHEALADARAAVDRTGLPGRR